MPGELVEQGQGVHARLRPGLAVAGRVDLALADPIVLGVIQDWNQYVEMVQECAEAGYSGEPYLRI